MELLRMINFAVTDEVALLEGIYKTNEQVNYVNYNLITPESSKRNFSQILCELQSCIVEASRECIKYQTCFKQLKRIHALSVTLGILPNFQSLACNLLETYKNLGKLRDAQNIFNQIQRPDIVSWTSLLNLHLHSNLPAESLAVFSLYIDSGFRPDSFLVVEALLSCGRGKDLIRGRAIHGMILRNHLDVNSIVACSHLGLVLEGKMLFNRMSHYHHLKPNIQHYGCLVDLLGRAGFLEEAKDVIEMMPIEPDAAI
ncbi:pentatricopeptide repeat-containing protein At2g46050, mitochondrial-like [Neltuma alba]|uniref:pentatricopeptide repeat-containing protein At2g46050, mitochondrial-like n=1 Tax=Neltuma alba TaxID=207710 RepID=UPI0010A489EE|nr:pentatricopeptide repeat-containing protein At2g46050, mitochondrial-like [Prosopis alba]